MICPHCMKTIEDGTAFCPHCHSFVGESATNEFVFCEGCGARLSLHDRTCPKCGRPAPGILSTESASSDLAAGKTASFPRLTKSLMQTESPHREPASAARALDDAVDPSNTNVLDTDEIEPSANRTGGIIEPEVDPYHPKKRSYKGLIVTLVVLALIGGSAAFVTLDPLGVMPGFYAWFRAAAQEAFPTRQIAEDGTVAPSVPADSSQPAEGQDPEQEPSEPLTDEQVYDRLMTAYEQIGAFNSEEAIGEVIDSFNSFYMAADLTLRQESSASAYSLRDSIQAVIDDLDSLQAPADTAYAEDIEHVRQLAQWMFDRVNPLCECWDISLAIPEGESTRSEEDEILAPLREAGSSALSNFDRYYYAWEPEQK